MYSSNVVDGSLSRISWCFSRRRKHTRATRVSGDQRCVYVAAEQRSALRGLFFFKQKTAYELSACLVGSAKKLGRVSPVLPATKK